MKNAINPEYEIQQLENKLVEAMQKTDLTVFEDLFSDNYAFIGSDGVSWGKDKALQDFKDPDFTLKHLEIHDRQIFMHDHTAVVTDISVIQGIVNNQDVSGRYRFMRVWSQNSGKWEIAAVYTAIAS